MIEIDKNIPLPQFNPGKGHRAKYPWNKMEVGDSFLYTIDTDKKSWHRAYAATSNASRSFMLKHKIKIVFKPHKTDEGIRIWRIE